MIDPKRFGRVALLMGGWSAEREVSLKSGATVLAALQAAGVDVTPIDVDRGIVARLAADRFDRAFIILHGRGGEDGQIQALLELLQIPYTGPDMTASAIGMDKLASKKLWLADGLPTPPWRQVTTVAEAEAAVADLVLPVMVKPVAEGSSVGVSKVDRPEQMAAAYTAAAQHGAVMIERYVTGDEYTVSILGDRALPVIRLATPHEFYDYDAKYLADDTEYRIPCGLSEQDEQDMQETALAAFRSIGCRGWGRVDFLRDVYGRNWLIEVNTVPGMTDHSLVPMSARAVGIDISALCVAILAQTLPDGGNEATFNSQAAGPEGREARNHEAG